MWQSLIFCLYFYPARNPSIKWRRGGRCNDLIIIPPQHSGTADSRDTNESDWEETVRVAIQSSLFPPPLPAGEIKSGQERWVQIRSSVSDRLMWGYNYISIRNCFKLFKTYFKHPNNSLRWGNLSEIVEYCWM